MTKKVTVTKKFEFCYAHYLTNYDGKCQKIHGHNSTLEVEVARSPHDCSNDGMVMDFSDIKKNMEPIIEMLDHSFINHLEEWNKWSRRHGTPLQSGGEGDMRATAENIIFFILDMLHEHHTGFWEKVVRIRLYETNDSYAEVEKEHV
mgnify:CR=1 FL=1